LAPPGIMIMTKPPKVESDFGGFEVLGLPDQTHQFCVGREFRVSRVLLALAFEKVHWHFGECDLSDGVFSEVCVSEVCGGVVSEELVSESGENPRALGVHGFCSFWK
jgi:hypothetical protein